jgi:hypothetical protein
MDGQKQAERAIPQRSRSCQQGQEMERLHGQTSHETSRKGLEEPRLASQQERQTRHRRQVVAVMDDGSWLLFPYIGPAAEWVGGSRENVGRCCRCNQARKVCKHDWRPGQSKGASRVNTDHRYKGIRFYFESDNEWTRKIRT